MEDGKRPDTPVDRYKVAYIIHFLLGAGNLLPWNAFITAIDYFSGMYPGRHIEKVFSVTYMGSSVLVLVLVVVRGGWCRNFSFRTRMNLGFSLFVLSVMVAPVLDWTGVAEGAKGGTGAGFGVTVGMVVVCGLADGLVGGSLIGSAGRLPKEYMQAVFAGTASSGVLVSLLRIFTKASLPQTPQGLRTSAIFYFIVSAFILLICIACCNLLDKLPVMRPYYSNLEGNLPRSRSLHLLEKIKWPAFGIVLIYLVTLSIFPGFIAENLKSPLLKDWYAIVLITAYNLADLTGKSLTAIYVLRSMKKAIWGCVARLAFYPLFYFSLHGPRWMRSEAPVTILTFLLGLTNGYLTSVLMILTPKSVLESEAESAAISMVVFLGVGLLGGSIIGWLWII